MIRKGLLSLCLAITIASSHGFAQKTETTIGAGKSAAQRAISHKSLQDLGKVVAQYIRKDYAIGAEVLVLQQGRVLYHESFGHSDREGKRKWENNTLCNIRSMTKPITAAAAQLLIDRDALNLDDPVAKYLESFDNDKSRAITVRQVLTHRSGLPLTNLMHPNQYTSLSEQVAAGGKEGPQFEPGSKFWYSDLGTDVVGALVEEVSGEPLHEFVTREILTPLGMSNSLYGIDAKDERLSRAASLYLKVPKGWTRFWAPDSKPIYPFAWGSQTVYSTTTDYAKFLRMMMNGGRVGDRQLLSAAAVGRMLEPVSRAKMMNSDVSMPTGFRNLEVYYGQMMITYRVERGDQKQPIIMGHSGSDGTCAWAWPARDLIILYFTQSRGGMTPLRIEEPIDDLIIHQGRIAADVPEQLRPYLGTFIANYGNFDNEEFTVKVRNGKLVLDVPSQLPFELLEPDENGHWAFALRPDKLKASFDRNESDEVVGLRLYQGDRVYEVPRKGTARAQELSKRADQPDSAATTWKGTLDAQGTKLRLEISISNKSGELTGELRSLDQGDARLELNDIKVEGDRLSFSIPQAGAKFSGKYSPQRTVATGTFEQNGASMPLELSKSETTAEVPNKGTLKEAWIGKLDLGGLQPVMQFRIVTSESGETTAYFDSVSEGRTDFKATWSIEGNQLKFDVARIKLKYRGTLNEAGDSAEGTWSQGGRDVPLKLKKHAKEYGK